MVRVVFVNSWNRALSWFFYAQGMSSPPYGMVRAATRLQQMGFEVSVLDAQRLELDPEDVTSRLQESGCDVVVVGGFSELHLHVFMGASVFPYDLELCQHLHLEMPQTRVFLSGYLPTLFPDAMSQYENVFDSLATSFEELCVNLKLSNFIQDRELPSPNYELLVPDITHYGIDLNLFLLPGKETVLPVLPVMTGIGCPFHCTFCATPAYFQGKSSLRPVRSVLDEIEYGIDRYQVKLWSVWDDTFTVQSERVKEFCQGLIERHLDISWWCFGMARWLLKHPELVGLMADAGCKMIWIGGESNENGQLKAYRKGVSMADTKDAAKLIKQHDILPTVSFLLGERDDDLSAVERKLDTYRAFERLGCVNIYTLLIPVPGTPLFSELSSSSQFRRNDLRSYSGVRSILASDPEVSDALEEIYFNAYCDSILSTRWQDNWDRANLGDPQPLLERKNVTTMVDLRRHARLHYDNLRQLEYGPGAKVDACHFVTSV